MSIRAIGRSWSFGMRGTAVVWAASVALLGPNPVAALDPPHDFSQSIDCSSCHTTHSSPGGLLGTETGNANLCLSCHLAGGSATALPFTDSDQARPFPGLANGSTASGTSHRWDSGPSGWSEPTAGNSSTGQVRSGGVFVGRFAKTYSITITAGGDAGAATFSWIATQPGGGSGNGTTGQAVTLDQGITVTFDDGTGSPSFLTGDQWQVHVRPDLAQPTDPEMIVRLDGEKLMCSTCHDQHSQVAQPFDPAAPVYAGAGTGAGRHFQRVDNDLGRLCIECHGARDVSQSSQGSHPVGLPLPGAGQYQAPVTVPLNALSEVDCLSCHQLHYAPTNDGALLRLSDPVSLCTDCHTLADTVSPASHLNAASGALWPGGQYGSTFPTVDPSRQGSCMNCHQPHGWPNNASPAQDYPLLLVDVEENLCDTCHDGSPVAPSIRAEFSKASAHPVAATSGVHQNDESAIVNSPARHVECADCHNPHVAKGRVSLPGPATTPRPASGPLAGARGVDFVGNEVAPAAFEYQVCLRCHGDSTGKPAVTTVRQFPESNVAREFDGNLASYHPVGMAGTNPYVPSLIGGWTHSSIMACSDCHNNNAGPNNGSGGPNGPHGSTRPTLLERRYETGDPVQFDIAKYDLCFKCHDWNNSLGQDQSFSEHDKHVRKEDVSCNICHDPHASQNPKLINFDTSVVSPFMGTMEYVSSGKYRGSCTLSCHGENHMNFDYKP